MLTWSGAFPEERFFWEGFDEAYFFGRADRLSRIGTYELGFRPGGTPAAHRAAEFILEEMRCLGLQDVRGEPFPVYAWEFAGASLEVAGWDPLPASSYPPTPGTPPGGLSGLLVDAGYGTAGDYTGIDVRGRIAFVRFDTARMPWMDTLAYEAELQGARALVFYYLNGYAQHPSGEALNTHDGAARTTLPILNLCRRDGARLAGRLAAEGPLPVTLHSRVRADPAGTGYNVLGVLPGRLAERYIIVGAHYDAWFHGYWDNAIGVAAILAMARVLLERGYQPEHTLLFVATDAEEFGAPDTHFDWLIGCHRLLEAHPEWQHRVSAAFNIDTLAFVAQDQLGLIAPPELVPFLQEATGKVRAGTFAQAQVWVKEQVTAWTETLTYAYFGIPPLQPRFALEEARRTIYHTQLDTAQVVQRERAVETVQLYGSLLVRLDRQPFLPYDFGQRVRSLRATVAPAPAASEQARLDASLDRLAEQAGRLEQRLAQADAGDLGPVRDAVNDGLRRVIAHLLRHINYLDATAQEDALPLHLFYRRDWQALDQALAQLADGQAHQAIELLTDPETGLSGAACALGMSYPVYYRHTLGAGNPGRRDLFWGQGRTAALTDVWAELHSLQDKLARGVTDFEAEVYTLQAKRQRAAAAYGEALGLLAVVLDEASALLEQVQALLAR